MNRICVLLAALSLAPGVALAAEYEPVSPPQPTSNPDKIEVVELFWYRCPSCYRLLPFMERWIEGSMPENVEFVRIPAILRNDWAFDARVYYTAEQLGVLETIHRPLFDAIHAERRPLTSDKAIEDFFAEYGVDREDFRKTWSSFAVETRVRRARVMTQRYGVTGTPSVVVNGRYRTDSGMTGNFGNLIRVLDDLVAQESARAAR